MASKLSPRRAAVLLAVPAVASALLSNYLPDDPGELLRFELIDKAPLLPGLYFGLVLCVGVFLFETRSLLGLAATLIAAVVAWPCAWETALAVYGRLEGTYSSATAYPIAGFVAGMVGSAITAVGISLVSPDFRAGASGIRTMALGAVAGLLLGFQDYSPLPLFLVWQPAVAASIAYGIVKPKSLRASAPA